MRLRRGSTGRLQNASGGFYGVPVGHLATGRIASGSRGRIISTMSLKSAALFALVGMILLTVVLALGFIRDISAFTSGAIAANAILVSLIHLLASLSVTVFLYVFYSKQS